MTTPIWRAMTFGQAPFVCKHRFVKEKPLQLYRFVAGDSTGKKILATCRSCRIPEKISWKLVQRIFLASPRPPSTALAVQRFVVPALQPSQSRDMCVQAARRSLFEARRNVVSLELL